MERRISRAQAHLHPHLATPRMPTLTDRTVFEIRVSDAENLSDSITVNVSVQSVDDAPTVANPISDITIQEDADLGSLSISSLFDDIDHDNSSIVISAASSNNSLLYVSVDGDFLLLRGTA